MREERLEYLEKLGAEKPRVTLPLFVEAPTAEAEPEVLFIGPLKKKGPKPPPQIVQSHGRRTRFVYEKVGPMAYLSHLDVIRALPRSFRRIGVPLFYTSGYHPKPDMMFSPALSLGVASLSEILDVKVTVDIDAEQGRAGACAVRARRARVQARRGARQGRPPTIAHAIDGARYAIAIPRKALAPLGGEARLTDEVEKFLAASEVRLIRKFERGLAKKVDARKYTRMIRLQDPRTPRFLDARARRGRLRLAPRRRRHDDRGRREGSAK